MPGGTCPLFVVSRRLNAREPSSNCSTSDRSSCDPLWVHALLLHDVGVMHLHDNHDRQSPKKQVLTTLDDGCLWSAAILVFAFCCACCDCFLQSYNAKGVTGDVLRLMITYIRSHGDIMWTAQALSEFYPLGAVCKRSSLSRVTLFGVTLLQSPVARVGFSFIVGLNVSHTDSGSLCVWLLLPAC